MSNVTESLPTEAQRRVRFVDIAVEEEFDNAAAKFKLCLREEYAEKLRDAIEAYQYWMLIDRGTRESIADTLVKYPITDWVPRILQMARKPTGIGAHAERVVAAVNKSTGHHIDPDESGAAPRKGGRK